MLTTILLSSSLGLSIACEARTKESPGKELHQKLEHPANWISAPVQLVAIGDLGYRLLLENNSNTSSSKEFYLVSIDGKPLRNLSVAEINGLLCGAPGSAVDLEVFCHGESIQPIKLLRVETSGKNVLVSAEELHSTLLKLEERKITASWNEVNPDDNLDLVSQAYDLLCYQAAKELPPPKPSLVERTALQACVNYQKSGDLDNAEYFEKIANPADKENFSPSYTELETLQKALLNLVALKKFAEADNLASSALASKNFSLSRDGSINTLRAIYTIPGPQRSPRLQEALDKLIGQDIRFGYGDPANAGALLESAGTPDKAQILYAGSARSYDSLIKQSKVSFTQIHNTALALYNSARLAAAAGKLTEAEDDLKKIETLFQKFFTAEERIVLNRMPLFYPNDDNLIKAEAALKSGKAISDQSTNHFDKNFVNLEFPLLSDFYQAIKQGDKNGAKKAAFDLLKKYQDQTPVISRRQVMRSRPVERRNEITNPTRQNLYCTALNMARKMADKGWYNDSGELLDALMRSMHQKYSIKATAIDAFIAAELTYNGVKSGRADQSVWNNLLKSAHFTTLHGTDQELAETPLWKDYPDSYRLRLLALSYYLAGQNDRAKILIEYALTMASDANSQNSVTLPNWYNPAQEKSFLVLDAACIEAKANNFIEADKVLAKGYTSAIVSESYARTLTELATIYATAGKEQQAAQILENEIETAGGALLAPSALDYDYQTKSTRQIEKASLGRIYAKYAQILFDQKKYARALQTTESAIKLGDQTTNYSIFLLAAKSARENKDYAEAAKNFLAAAQTRRFGVEQFQISEDLSLVYLNEAMQNAEMAKDMDKKDFSAICIELAKKSTRDRVKELALYEKAFALTDSGDTNRTLIAANIARLRGQEANNHPGSTTEDLNSKINQALSAAQFAEANHVADYFRYWIDVALLEARAKRFDPALEHIKHSLAAYKPGPGDRYQGMFSPLGKIQQVADALYRNGMKDQAKQILQDTTDRVKALTGASSQATQIQMVMQMDYYVSHDQEAEGAKVLDFILAAQDGKDYYKTDDRTSRLRTHFAGSSAEPFAALKEYFKNQTITRNYEWNLQALIKLQERERKILLPDDRILAATELLLAKTCEGAHKYVQAEKAFLEYIRIMKKYESEERVRMNIRSDYASVLRQLGRVDEADKLMQR